MECRGRRRRSASEQWRIALPRPVGHLKGVPYSHPQLVTREEALERNPHLLPGALAFAGTAGFINSIALGAFGSPVSHMTGAVSYFGLELAGSRLHNALTTLTIILSFMLGAALAGLIVGALDLAPGRRYGWALCCEGALLAASMALLTSGHTSGVLLIAMACGLQNATTSSYFGLMIRTTHVTGTVTDIGVMLGHWLRHRHIERRKLVFMVGVVAAFGTGVWIGALADARWGPSVLGIAAAGCLAAGVGVILFPRWFLALANPVK
jgi:uncharacterized membrane protein YoaK (UPF0700 family)